MKVRPHYFFFRCKWWHLYERKVIIMMNCINCEPCSRHKKEDQKEEFWCDIWKSRLFKAVDGNDYCEFYKEDQAKA